MKAGKSPPSFFQVHIIRVPWLIPKWVRAQTWGNVILVRQGFDLTERFLAHELAHVLQWKSLGVLRFMFHYLRHLIRHGYEEHPLEIAARSAEKHAYYLQWARELLDVKKEPGAGAAGL